MRNAIELDFHVPEPPARPGDTPDFSYLKIPKAGELKRPPVSAPAADIRNLAYDLVRVLDDNHQAVGSWKPAVSTELMLQGLRSMLLTRYYDARMLASHRQGKTSFYIPSTGEEAVSVGGALALSNDDMCFTAGRQQGVLIARGWPLVDMMCQIFCNRADRMKGRQLPIMYSAKESGFFSIPGNLCTQYIQAVGWAMASAYSRDSRIAAAWVGEGATAEGDFHHAMTFASIYQAPVVLNVVNNQWAISSFQSFAGGERTTFAARAIGYGIPGIRVDGNDFLAVFAATQWAAERASANLGPTLIENVTYRVAPHSTSDDPSRYRPKDEAASWPLGDPIERLKLHLIQQGHWSEEKHAALEKEVQEFVREAAREAEAQGTLDQGAHPPPETMFEDVFKEMPLHLRRQQQQAAQS